MRPFYTTIRLVRPGAEASEESNRRRGWFFAAAIACLSLAATWVGLSGTWVGDDWHMVDSLVYRDWAELGAVFQRNAAYYLSADDKVGPYRPITMLSLIGTHLIQPSPWLHHLVSWLLHATVALCLFGAVRRQLAEHSDRTSTQVAAFLAALFFLHPVGVEAYVWINGRSDLMAGFWLVALALLLGRDRPHGMDRARGAFVVAFVTFLGAGSKLPFVIAAFSLWLAWGLRERSARRMIYGAAMVAAVALHVILRSVFAPFSGALGTSENLFLDPNVWFTVPKLIAQGAIAVLTFRAEAMQSLSWLLFGPWTPVEGVALAAAIGVGALLAWRRDWSSLVYYLGAWAALVPVVAVSRSFWIGFDRYLYMPGILLLMAFAPYALAATKRLRPEATVALAAALLVLAGVQTHRASATYAGQDAYDAALLRDHADDPSIHYYLARAADRSGDEPALRARLADMPPPPWPQPIVVPVFELAEKVSNSSLAIQAVDELRVSVEDGYSCAEARDKLERWLSRSRDEALSHALEQALAAMPCSR